MRTATSSEDVLKEGVLRPLWPNDDRYNNHITKIIPGTVVPYPYYKITFLVD